MKLIRKSTDLLKTAASAKAVWGLMKAYIGLGKRAKNQPIGDIETLRVFLQTRSSHVAQTSLYGYLRTRAGTRYPELFENPRMLVSINIAKWQMWLACLSDLAIYVGGLIRRGDPVPDEALRQLLRDAVEAIFEEVGVPEEAGDRFVETRQQLIQRIETFDWTGFQDDESVFTESPRALIYWAPIADSLKKWDDQIVRNSVRFRWQEVRRSARKQLHRTALVEGRLMTTDEGH